MKTWEEVKDAVGKREIVQWGIGDFAPYCLELLHRHILEESSDVAFFVSRDYKITPFYQGKCVHNKDVLDRDKHFVIIGTLYYSDEIANELVCLGFIENLDFFKYQLLNEMSTVEYIELYKTKFGVNSNIRDRTDKLKSSVCRLSDLFAYTRWTTLKGNNEPLLNRKYWEHVYITQVLFENGMLKERKRGIGFAVGLERLPALFAKHGVEVIATDMDKDSNNAKGWIQSDQHSEGIIDNLFYSDICKYSEFTKNVRYITLDMNNIPDTIRGFDFCWSSCAFEHLGSAQKGMDFIIKSLDVLNPGGISVHTTEFNLSSNETIDVPFNAIYGRHFFDNLRIEIERRGHVFEPVDYRLGDNPKEDDVQYYNQPQKPHIKVSAYGTVFTSIGITIKKAKLKNR